MIRSFFLACGTFISLCGGLLLLVDRVVLTDMAARHFHAGSATTAAMPLEKPAGSETPWRFVTHDTVDPPDWSAFGLLSLGGVTLLYTFSLPGRRAEDQDEDEDEPEYVALRKV